MLGELGRSRIANNLNQLARAANSGSLPVTPETVQAKREGLALTALGPEAPYERSNVSHRLAVMRGSQARARRSTKPARSVSIATPKAGRGKRRSAGQGSRRTRRSGPWSRGTERALGRPSVSGAAKRPRVRDRRPEGRNPRSGVRFSRARSCEAEDGTGRARMKLMWITRKTRIDA
ncbi:MAG: plasmid mobilization relaxosome protein MobC [Alphaproteobacteria bacterium]